MSESRSAEVLARRRLALGATDPIAADDAGTSSLGVSVNATVNPVQTTTYHLKPANNPITFGATTNIHTTASGQSAVVGGTSATYNVTNLGALTGAAYGVQLKSVGSTLTNAGSITGNGSDGANLAEGEVINEAGATIKGDRDGLLFDGGRGVAVNGGTISASVIGVQFDSGGSLKNAAGGLVTGLYGVKATSVSASIVNSGNIVGNVGAGVLLASGSVSNKAGAVIRGGIDGLLIQAAGSVQNGGIIEGYVFPTDGVGVEMASGSLTNFASGMILGAGGVAFDSGAGTLSNIGVIRAEADTLAGVFRDGVTLGAGGVVTNQHHGLIYGSAGIYAKNARASITNAGTITGAVAEGVKLTAGGSVANQAGGVISGKTNGVAISGAAGTVTDAGKITGATDSVLFTGSGANQLILQTGAVLSGKAVGSTAAGATNALILQGSGTSTNQFQNFTSLTVEASTTRTLFGQIAFATASIASGTLQIGNASHTSSKLTLTGTLANAGVLEVGGGEIDVDGAVTGAGSAAIAEGVLKFGSAFSENVAFTGTSGTLQLAKSQSYTGAVSGFSGSDTLDLADISFIAGKTKATFAPNGSHTAGVLTVTDGTHAAHISLSGSFTGSTFTVASDGHGGTKVVDPHPGASILPLVTAMAAMGGGGWAAVAEPEHSPSRMFSLAVVSGRG